MQERYNTMGGKHVWVQHQAGWSVGTFTIMSRLLVQTAHCTLQSLTWLQYWNSRVWCKFWWCITKLALLIATHNLAFTAVNSPNALKDSMHAIMESYEVTPHIYQYFTNTINVINCVILLPRSALLMLCLSESSTSIVQTASLAMFLWLIKNHYHYHHPHHHQHHMKTLCMVQVRVGLTRAPPS